MDLTEVWRALRATVARFSPRHRQWRRFLRELPLDPDRLGRPITPPTERDLLICGSPRTGTALLTAMLFQPPTIVSVMEPWDGMRLPPAELFASLRHEIETTGKLRRGKLDIEALLAEGVVRWCQEGESVVELEPGPDYLLAVKWPAYWRYLELLPDAKFLVCIRHPVTTINSYKRNGGRLARGLEYETRFNDAMNHELRSATRDLATRRILFYDYINSRLLPHLSRDNVLVVRYERWFTGVKEMMQEIGAFLGCDLGPGPAAIHPPRPAVALTPGEIALIRDQCNTAEPLGYDLGSIPEYVR